MHDIAELAKACLILASQPLYTDIDSTLLLSLLPEKKEVQQYPHFVHLNTEWWGQENRAKSSPWTECVKGYRRLTSLHLAGVTWGGGLHYSRISPIVYWTRGLTKCGVLSDWNASSVNSSSKCYGSSQAWRQLKL